MLNLSVSVLIIGFCNKGPYKYIAVFNFADATFRLHLHCTRVTNVDCKCYIVVFSSGWNVNVNDKMCVADYTTIGNTLLNGKLD